MKSPVELSVALRRHWENPALREARLLGLENVWPVMVTIRRPSPREIRTDLDVVKQHVETWRRVTIGEVMWESIRYRVTDTAVEIPTGWKFHKPSEWIHACGDDSITREFDNLGKLVEHTAPLFHSLLVRQRSLWRGKPITEVVQACRLALVLKPGDAAGRPLRALSIEGIDTKFFERHEHLVTSLLDVRFDGMVSEIGLETFLNAYAESDHWLLVVDLDGTLLPFGKQRVRTSELREVSLPGERLLIIENESCQHQIPPVPDTVAVFGAGFDLNWAVNLKNSKKRIAYWGDIDTWGLQFLAKARESIGDLDALLMSVEIYEQFKQAAVIEPVVASDDYPLALSQSEQLLYMKLLREPRGRLEQEFISEELIRETILNWADGRIHRAPTGNI